MKIMKACAITLMFLLPLVSMGQSYAGDSNNGEENAIEEYLVLRVYYRTKSSEIVTELKLDKGAKVPHSLRGVMENGEDGTIRITEEGGQPLVLHNEVDFLNYITSIGWKLKDSVPLRIADRTYVHHIFVKRR